MATVETGEPTESGSDDLPTPEEAAGEERYESPDRKHVDVLLEISEEELLKELEPPEYHCYSGWEEAVRGWTRAGPLSCILMTQKDGKKLKQRESADAVLSNAEGPATSNTPDQLNQHAGSRCHAVGAGPLQGQASRWPVIRAGQRSPPQLLQGENPEELREAPAAIRPARTQKPSHTSDTLVPIRHFTFLPPIPSPRPRPRALADGAKAPDVRSSEDICGKNSRVSGTKVATLNPEPPAGAGQNHQDHPHLFSVISVAAQSRNLISGASKRNTAHCRRLPSGKKVLHFGGANPSKTVCAVNL